MLDTRLRKILRDLWQNKTSALLVILSIAVGVFAIGTVIGAHAILSQRVTESFRVVHPADGIFGAINSFPEELIDSIRNMDEVQQAAGRYRLNVRLQVGENQWRKLQLFAVADYDDLAVNRVLPDGGAWPPPEREILIERDAMIFLGVEVGDTLRIETDDGKLRELPVAGVVHEMTLYPAQLAGRGYGYISYETLQWLGIPYSFNYVYVISEERADREVYLNTLHLVQDRLEENNQKIEFTYIPPLPDRHEAQDLIEAVIVILGVLGVLVLLLSGLLVVNTISGMLVQQVRHIGIMKTIGARFEQLVMMYLGLALIFGLLAVAIGMPFSRLGAYELCNFILRKTNLTVSSYDFPSYVYAIQILVGILVPIAATLYPVISGTRITITEALNQNSRGQTNFILSSRHASVARIFNRFVSRFVSRPLLLSIRNTFRQMGRVILTFITLTLGWAMIMAVLSVYASTENTFDEIARYWQYDVELTLQRPYRFKRVQQALQQVPGVVGAEGWGITSARRVRADDSESRNVLLFAPPAESDLLDPIVIAGRWLHPDDENAIVVDLDFLLNEPDVKVGDELRFKIEGRETTWHVVGIVKSQFRDTPVLYANYPYFAAMVVRDIEQVSQVMVVSEQHDAAFQSQVAGVIEQHFKREDIDISATETISEIRDKVKRQFDSVNMILLSMATLISIVGLLGLTGTITLNVIERTREIGIMRAIGASNRAVQWLVMREGILIGLLSWAAGAMLAQPLSKVLSDSVGEAVTQTPLSYVFPPGMLLICLVAAVLLCALATFLPAFSASRISIKETLAHE